jgi:hypothetical protein
VLAQGKLVPEAGGGPIAHDTGVMDAESALMRGKALAKPLMLVRVAVHAERFVFDPERIETVVQPAALRDQIGKFTHIGKMTQGSCPVVGGVLEERRSNPRPRNIELLEQGDGVAIGHPCDEISQGGVASLLLDSAPIEELVGPLANLLP